MSNKTRADVIAQLKSYVPNLNASDHDTTVDNLIDLAAEIVSSRHNFTYLRETTPATHDIAAAEYSVAESEFSFTNFKEALFFEWINSTTGENARIRYLSERQFHDRYRYISFSGVTSGKPKYYTRVGKTFLLNCPLDEDVTARVWYQKYHGAFTDDDTSHGFEPNMLGFQAIVCVALQEVQRFVPGLQLSQKAQAAAMNAEVWIERLIQADLIKSDEDIEIEPLHTRGSSGGQTDPYSWVS